MASTCVVSVDCWDADNGFVVVFNELKVQICDSWCRERSAKTIV